MERRGHQRRPFWLPLEVDGLEVEVAVSHDASPRGLLLVCRTDVPVDARLKVRLRVPPGESTGRELELDARVVRTSRNDEDPYGLWPYKVAVEFATSSPELEAFLAGVREPAHG
jgi:hypothetical protein